MKSWIIAWTDKLCWFGQLVYKHIGHASLPCPGQAAERGHVYAGPEVNEAVMSCCILFCIVLLGAMHAVGDLEEVLQEC